MTTHQDFLTVLTAAKPHPQLEWLLDTASVATGFDVTPEAIRSQKSRHSDELTEGHHWIKDGQRTIWTKAGVIRLGFFVESGRAAEFRDFAESFILSQSGSALQNVTLNSGEALQSIADEIALETIQRQLPDLVSASIERLTAQRGSLATLVRELGYSVPKSWGAQ